MSKTEKKKYPIGAEYYELYEEVGHGVSASVRRALCIPMNEIVAIKILDFERGNSDLSNICREAQTMVLVDHPNVLKSHCSFVSDHNLWVVMPYMAGGSCLHILKAAYPDGFEEVAIATILREALKGLEYLHSQGHIHRDVKAGNILIDTKGQVKLGDFGVSACLFDSGDRQRTRNTFVGTPCWMAPEVMEQLHGYDFKADIWSFGITALELAHGHAPFSKYPPMKVLLMTLQNAPPGLDYERDKKFSKSFKQMIASCLVKDPSKRPSAKKLLRHSFFKQAKSSDYILKNFLEGLPALGERIKALKRREEDMLAHREIPDGQMEEISQNEYKRGISGWNFNLDDMKAQASLIPEVDDTDNSLGGSSTSLSTLDAHDKQPQCPSLSDMEDNDQRSRLLQIDLTTNNTKSYQSDDDTSTVGYVSHTTSPRHDANSGNSLVEKPDSEIIRRVLDGTSINSQQKKGGSPGNSLLPEASVSSTKTERLGICDKAPNQLHSIQSFHGATVTAAGDDGLPEVPSRASKSSVNSDDLEEKPKAPVVQQRGRFKVTSENIELPKVISPHYGMALPSPSSEAAQSTPSGSTLFSLLYSLLQINIIQRDSILYLMKQITCADPGALRTIDAAQVAAIEKSMLDASHEREKDLVHEIADLQRRYIIIQEELQKYKTEHAQV